MLGDLLEGAITEVAIEKCGPQVAAQNTNFLSYANGNLASQKFINQAILDDRGIYPDEETMKRLYTAKARDVTTQRWAREWEPAKERKQLVQQRPHRYLSRDEPRRGGDLERCTIG